LDQPFRYDVTVSFAGEDRPTVEHLVRILRRNGVRVFYDAWEQSNLWGKDLYQHLDAVYRTAARYCLIFVSKHYVAKAWAQHELKSAQARAFVENIEYILPIRLDDTELPGIPPTIAYLDTRDTSLAEIAQIFVAKLGLKRDIDIATLLDSGDPEDRSKALTEIALRCNPAFFDRVIELMLSDRETDVRENAARALDNLNDPRAFPSLVEAIHDPQFSVRSAAGWALVHLGADLVAAEMQRLYNTSDNHGAKEMALLVLQNL
jgi:hypothetical protein